jgi:hypothetical protein
MNIQATKPTQVAVPRHDIEVHAGNDRFFFREGRKYAVIERDEFYTKLATRRGEVMLTTEMVDASFNVLDLN